MDAFGSAPETALPRSYSRKADPGARHFAAGPALREGCLARCAWAQARRRPPAHREGLQRRSPHDAARAEGAQLAARVILHDESADVQTQLAEDTLLPVGANNVGNAR
eukprot:CAMPEP_0119061150 /NCGR_PEP_ID=MMETSP1178-20130426/4991_1 /TAXON_ID=33656 /ORGANISM="unid sp, Strain CCMP2000" /LENGTH=107 /DNA_ID=CAMNT_0007042331 /DNA_START=77 /DNA_END=397 /DNA_ORIENTATION=-